MNLNNKIKIVYLIPSLKVAGAEKVVIDLSDNLDHNLFDVHIISLSDAIPFTNLIINKDKLNIHTLSLGKIGFPWLSLKVFRRFYDKVKCINPDLIHSHLWSINCFYLLAIFLIKKEIKIFSTVHTNELHYTSPKLIYKFFKFVEVAILKMHKAEIVAISKPVEYLSKNNLKFSNVRLIPNGVDINKFKKKDTNKLTRESIGAKGTDILIISVGRYSEQKGQIYALEAFKQIAHLNENVKLLFVGRDIEENLKPICVNLGLEHRVIFLGVRLDIPEILSICDIGIFPSLVEGMGLAFAEMMCCGLPVVASDLDVLKEISNNGEGAYHVLRGSSSNLAEGIIYLIENPEVRKDIARKGRVLIENNYSLKRQIEKHEELYLSKVNTYKIN